MWSARAKTMSKKLYFILPISFFDSGLCNLPKYFVSPNGLCGVSRYDTSSSLFSELNLYRLIVEQVIFLQPRIKALILGFFPSILNKITRQR